MRQIIYYPILILPCASFVFETQLQVVAAGVSVTRLVEAKLLLWE